MKHIYSILIVLFCCVLSACTTSQRVIISGVPGTEIYSPNKEKLAVINEVGKAKVELPSKNYYAFLLSRQPNTAQYVPFALDYKHRSYSTAKVLSYAGYGVMAVSAVPFLGGMIMMLVEGEAALMLGGLGGVLLGCGIGAPFTDRRSQTQYEYQYEYLSSCSTNQDLHFVPIIDNGAKKTNPSFAPKSIVKGSVSSKSKTSLSKVKTTPSSKTLKDYARFVSGAYTGNGILRKDDETIEQYDKIQIVISRINNTTVQVNVIEGGESFFNEKLSYTVKKADIGYEMCLEENPNVFMNVNAVGEISFIHPLVDIDGEIYTLEISARKQ